MLAYSQADYRKLAQSVDKEIALLPLQPRLLNYFAAEFAALQAIDLMNCTTTGLLNALLALPSLSNLLDVRSLALVEDLLRLDAEIEMAQELAWALSNEWCNLEHFQAPRMAS